MAGGARRLRHKDEACCVAVCGRAHCCVTTAVNGAPGRLGDRIAAETFERDQKVFLVAAPAPLDAGLVEQVLAAPRDRAARYGDAYDRVWERSTKLYFSQPDAAQRL